MIKNSFKNYYTIMKLIEYFVFGGSNFYAREASDGHRQSFDQQENGLQSNLHVAVNEKKDNLKRSMQNKCEM